MAMKHRKLTEHERQNLERIARSHGFSLQRLREPGKLRAFCLARSDCYRWLRAEGWTTPEMGDLFNRDHRTIAYALDNRGTAEIKRERARNWHKIHAAGEKPLGARRV